MATPATLTPGQIISKHQTAPPVDVVAIANELGLKVWEMRSLPPTVSGKIFRDPDHGGESGFSIAVNGNEEHAARKRFTIAHEVAHFILHREYLEKKDGVIDDAMYRSGMSTKEEAQANNLAAQILMPMHLIQQLIQSGFTNPEQLAEKLDVSPTAMKIRLGIPT
jgi:hypothetical protein